MRFLSSLCVASLLAACQGEGSVTVVEPGDSGTTSSTTTGTSATVTTKGGGGACGAITHHQVSVSGRVVTAGGDPASFADVRVEDRGWNPTTITIGSTTADQMGNFTVQIDDLVSAEDCWGTLLDYVLVGQQGPISGERNINTPLFNAINDGSNAADVAPLTLE